MAVTNANERPWWLRLRFVEGAWEIIGQTQDEATVRRWDDEIAEREARTDIDNEWIVATPYGAARVIDDDRLGGTRVRPLTNGPADG